MRMYLFLLSKYLGYTFYLLPARRKAARFYTFPISGAFGPSLLRYLALINKEIATQFYRHGRGQEDVFAPAIVRLITMTAPERDREIENR